MKSSRLRIRSSTKDAVKVNAARLRMDARKWVASKLKPRKYGDKVALTGHDDGPVKTEAKNYTIGANIPYAEALAAYEKLMKA